MSEITDIGVTRRCKNNIPVTLELFIDPGSRELDVVYDLPEGITPRMFADCLATLADHIIK